MFKTDKTLTVVNRITDGRTDKTRYFCHVFDGCGWFAEHAVAAGSVSASSSHGTKPARKVKARLPAANCPGFVPPAQWAALDDDARATAWTLDSQTLIALGSHPAADAAALRTLQKYGDAMQVTLWHDHTDTVFPHYYAEGE